MFDKALLAFKSASNFPVPLAQYIFTTNAGQIRQIVVNVFSKDTQLIGPLNLLRFDR